MIVVFPKAVALVALLGLTAVTPAWEVTERDGVVIAGTAAADGPALGVFCSPGSGAVRVTYRPDAPFPTTKLMDVEIRFGAEPPASGLWEATGDLLVTDDYEQVRAFVAGALRTPEVTIKPAGLPPRRFTTEGFAAAMQGLIERCRPAARTEDRSL